MQHFWRLALVWGALPILTAPAVSAAVFSERAPAANFRPLVPVNGMMGGGGGGGGGFYGGGGGFGGGVAAGAAIGALLGGMASQPSYQPPGGYYPPPPQDYPPPQYVAPQPQYTPPPPPPVYSAAPAPPPVSDTPVSDAAPAQPAAPAYTPTAQIMTTSAAATLDTTCDATPTPVPAPAPPAPPAAGVPTTYVWTQNEPIVTGEYQVESLPRAVLDTFTLGLFAAEPVRTYSDPVPVPHSITQDSRLPPPPAYEAAKGPPALQELYKSFPQ